jgi:hypothetical protein
METYGRTVATSVGIRAWLAESPSRRSIARIALYLVATRVVLLLVSYWAVKTGHARLHPAQKHELACGPALVGWMRWDVEWYLSIVRDGYSFDPDEASNVAFMPGFPAVVWLVNLIVRKSQISGLLVANASFAGALFVLWSWVRERAGLDAAERAALFLVLYPLSFFCNTAYAESFFLLSCTLSLRDADRGEWLRAGIFASIATLTRPVGIFLLPAFAWALVSELRGIELAKAATAAIVLPLASLGALALYLWAALGSPFVMLQAQHIGWNVGHEWNLPVLKARKRIGMQFVLDVFQLVLPILLVWFTAKAWRKLGAVSGIYAALAACMATFMAGDSLGRETVSIVPVFAAAGLASLSPSTTVAFRLASLALLVSFAYAFVTGDFMG